MFFFDGIEFACVFIFRFIFEKMNVRIWWNLCFVQNAVTACL